MIYGLGIPWGMESIFCKNFVLIQAQAYVLHECTEFMPFWGQVQPVVVPRFVSCFLGLSFLHAAAELA